jgi:hypothetical protein
MTNAIQHDSPITEIWVTENGRKLRVYRGDTKAHIEWKLKEHKDKDPETIEEIGTCE